MRRALAPLALAAALAWTPALAAAARGGAPPAAGPAAGTESDSGAFTVYLPQPPAPAARPAARLPAPPQGESGLAVGLAALFAAVGLAWLGLRPPACPRCRQKLVRLERAGGADGRPSLAGDAVRPIEDFIDGARRDPWACLGCGVVMRRRFGPLVAADAACPSCGAPTKKTQLTVVDRPGYLTWGEVRLDEGCLTCSHRTSALYAAPPLEAPTAERGAARSARAAAASRPSRPPR